MVEAKEVVRIPISITLPKECVDWLDKKVESRQYANRSHGLELLILAAIKNEKKESA
jgi:Arc/MetJ-type ribon-helix-helix transcriptional regulator